MERVLERTPHLELRGSGALPPPPSETQNETGGPDGDRFWRIVRGPDGLGALTIEQAQQHD
ncbi:hypothetical protein KBD20_03025 [Candidatus Saccharibacteria bacterium]|nr:hypothetical protein [Candidatus Saccharibacteria bacterium]